MPVLRASTGAITKIGMNVPIVVRSWGELLKTWLAVANGACKRQVRHVTCQAGDVVFQTDTLGACLGGKSGPPAGPNKGVRAWRHDGPPGASIILTSAKPAASSIPFDTKRLDGL